ncbi:MAG TPA: hypothetical protein PKV79_09050 [Candidatus Marinimicrobia bacterium]|jgi:hypothetical protein|nr:hypothetical protein [Candidatus Neomarinimicrobiota bacterium]
MKTKTWKKMISSIFVLLICMQISLADDVRLKIPETTVNNLMAAVMESKYLSYGTSDAGGIVTYYSIKPQNVTLDVSSGNQFSLSMDVDAMANFDLVLFGFPLYLNNQSFTITGIISLQTQGTGYKITFVPQDIVYDGDNWLKNIINIGLNLFLSKIPEISTSSSQPLLPSIATSYFTSATPTLTTTDTEIVLGLTLVAGPRYIIAQNEVNLEFIF